MCIGVLFGGHWCLLGVCSGLRPSASTGQVSHLSLSLSLAVCLSVSVSRHHFHGHSQKQSGTRPMIRATKFCYIWQWSCMLYTLPLFIHVLHDSCITSKCEAVVVVLARTYSSPRTRTIQTRCDISAHDYLYSVARVRVGNHTCIPSLLLPACRGR